MKDSTQRNNNLVQIMVLTALLGGLVFSARPSSASYIGTPFTEERPRLFDLHVGMAYYDVGMAAGGRFGVPLVDNGFIKSINNAVYLTFGADFYLFNYHNEAHGGLGVPIALHWEFYFSDKWSAYGEAGVNIFFHPSIFQGDGWTSSPGHWVAGSVGGRYHVNDKVSLTLHVGNPYSSFGVLFKF